MKLNKLTLIIALTSFAFTNDAISATLLKANDFMGSKLRGFNIGLIENHNDAYYKELKQSNANIVRVIIPFERCAVTAEQMKAAQEKAKDAESADALEKAMMPEPPCTYQVSKETEAKFKNLLIKAVENNFYVLPAASFEQRTPGDFWFTSKLQQGMSEAWQEFAKNHENNTVIAGYDLMNSPNGTGLPANSNVSDYWNQGAGFLIKAIRKVDTKHPIIVTMAPYGQATSLKDFKPFDDKNIVYGINMYYPYDITMQGTSPTYEYRLPYPAGLEYGIQPNPTQPPKPINSKELRLHLQSAALFGITNKVPIIVSEFGIVHYAPDGSGFRYVSDATKIFEENGWSWIYQGFRVSKAMDPYIASDDPEDENRASNAPIIKVLTSYFSKNGNTNKNNNEEE